MKHGEMSKVVPFARSRRVPDPARVAEFAAMARRLQREREESADVVTRVLRETPREEWPRLAPLRTSGALDRLSEEVETRLDRAPLEALAIAEAATDIAAQLPADSYPPIVIAQHRAHAWKDRGQALTFLGRYDEALTALDRAEESLEPVGTLAHDVAIVRFVRATALQHLRRFDDAHALLEHCAKVFRDHGDVRMFAKCTLAKGNLLVRRGDYRAARVALSVVVSGPEEALVPIARMALGWCAIHLREPAEALYEFTNAARAYVQLGRDVEVVRAHYGAGSALLHLSRFDEAIARLRPARDTMLRRGLIEEAGLSGLQIVEAYLALGDVLQARTLAASLVAEFTQANLNRRAVAALAYLNEAIAASSATIDTVRFVHSYVSALRTDPTREFAPVN